MEDHEPLRIARTRDIVAGTVKKGNYTPEWQPMRPGADDHENVPSLHCGTRTWRDGRQEAEK